MRRRSSQAIHLGVLLMFQTPSVVAFAQGATSTNAVLAHRVDSAMKAFIGAGDGVGMSVAITRGSDTVLTGGWGFADIGSSTRATANTSYRIGSMTKQFTAALVMRLQEKHRLVLSDSIGAYVADLPPRWRSIPILFLMNHTSGVPDYTANREWQAHGADSLSPRQTIGYVANDTLRFAPGAGWAYSNTGYLLLGLLIEARYGKPYAQIVTDEIAKPLGLAQTRFCESESRANGQAQGYVRAGPTAPFTPAAPHHMMTAFSAGGLCSTVVDFAQWAMALHLGRVVGPDSYAAMTTPQGPANLPRPGPQKSRYAFGLQAEQVAAVPALFHGGVTTGFISSTAWIPTDSVSVTILTNSPHGAAAFRALLDNIAAMAIAKWRPF